MNTITRASLALPLVLGLAAAQVYYPGRHEWERRSPAQAGLDPQKLEAAIAFARTSETANSRELEMLHYASHSREPFSDPLGPFSRAATSPASSCATATWWPNGASRSAWT